MKLERFCPKCGKTEKDVKFIDSFCKTCWLEENKAFELPEKITVDECPKCGAFYFKGREVSQGSEGLKEAINSQFKPLERAKFQELSIEFSDETEKSIMALVKVKGIVSDSFHEFEREVEVEFKKKQCDTCNRLSGNYYEAVVQLRFDKDASREKREQVLEDFKADLNSLQERGFKLAFVSKQVTGKEGWDLYVGSKRAAKRVTEKLARERGLKLTTSKTLYGLKDGQKVYRATYCLRF